MVVGGDVVFVSCRGNQGLVRVRGRAVEVDGDLGVVVLACQSSIGRHLDQKIEAGEEGKRLTFLKVPLSAASTKTPPGWGSVVGGSAPELDEALPLWDKVSKEMALESSEAEVQSLAMQPKKVKTSMAAAGGRKSQPSGLAEELQRMQQDLWGKSGGGSSEDESSEEETEEELPPRSRKHLAPGASALKKPSKKDSAASSSKSKRDNPPGLEEVMGQAVASGADATQLLPMMMMAYMMKQDKAAEEKKKRSRKKGRSLGGSGSDTSSETEDEEAGGLKAVDALNHMHRRITRHPKRLIREFEKTIVEELGVVPGQAWSVKEWVRKQNFGKFKGLYRATMMDVAVYEFLRGGDEAAAAAQLTQNIKAKIQCCLAGGDWSTAWLLTGLQDPLLRREWAGTREEMSIVSGYVRALSKVRKHVKEAHQSAETKEDQE